MITRWTSALLMTALLGVAGPAAAEDWFLPDVFPNHHLAATHKLAGVENVGSGKPVFWMPTLESNYWNTGNWTRTLVPAGEPPCCWDMNQWSGDGDRGRGGYFDRADGETYDTWIGSQPRPTFPMIVEMDALPITRVVRGGTVTGLRVRRGSDTVVGYLDREGKCCSDEPIVLQGGNVLIKLSKVVSLVPGQAVLKLEGWGVDDAGRRTTRGEAFYFCRGCLTVDDKPADGPMRWEITEVEGYVAQQWTFTRWVPRTAEDVVDTMRPEVDRLRRTVVTLEKANVALEAANAALEEELATCRP